MTESYKNITYMGDGNVEGEQFYPSTRQWHHFKASLHLFLIREAWGRVDFSDLAIAGDDSDWSMIRDADSQAHSMMLERALNHFFPKN